MKRLRCVLYETVKCESSIGRDVVGDTDVGQRAIYNIFTEIRRTWIGLILYNVRTSHGLL
jgi:hypothetical protein